MCVRDERKRDKSGQKVMDFRFFFFPCAASQASLVNSERMLKWARLPSGPEMRLNFQMKKQHVWMLVFRSDTRLGKTFPEFRYYIKNRSGTLCKWEKHFIFLLTTWEVRTAWDDCNNLAIIQKIKKMKRMLPFGLELNSDQAYKQTEQSNVCMCGRFVIHVRKSLLWKKSHIGARVLSHWRQSCTVFPKRRSSVGIFLFFFMFQAACLWFWLHLQGPLLHGVTS